MDDFRRGRSTPTLQQIPPFSVEVEACEALSEEPESRILISLKVYPNFRQLQLLYVARKGSIAKIRPIFHSLFSLFNSFCCGSYNYIDAKVISACFQSPHILGY
jgi:hypothetical protein